MGLSTGQTIHSLWQSPAFQDSHPAFQHSQHCFFPPYWSSIFWPVTQLGLCLWWTQPIKCMLAQTGMHLIMAQCSFTELNMLCFSCIHYCLAISHHSLETFCLPLYCIIREVLVRHHNESKFPKSPFRNGTFYCHLVLLYVKLYVFLSLCKSFNRNIMEIRLKN